MRALESFKVLHNTLLRPGQLIHSPDPHLFWLRRYLVVALTWVALSGIVTDLVVLWGLHISVEHLLVGVLIVYSIAVVSGLLVVAIGSERQCLSACGLWLIQSHLVLTPILEPALSILCSPTGWGLGRLAFLLLGVCLAELMTIGFVLQQGNVETNTVRGLVAGTTLFLALLISCSATFSEQEKELLVPFLVVVGASMVRPLSWLCESAASLGLLGALHLGLPVQQVRRLHPVRVDELCLLPLPGLRRLLVIACQHNVEHGVEWLLEVARHPGQSWAATAALHTLVQRGINTHHVLLQLCACPDGCALLHELSTRPATIHPLIAAYDDLNHVVEPAAWPTEIARLLQIFELQREQAGALLTFLHAAAAILSADRWAGAVATLRGLSCPGAAGFDQFQAILTNLQGWVNEGEKETPATLIERGGMVLDQVPDLYGWPAVLLAAVREHLLFLLRIEQHRGARLRDTLR